MKIAQNINVFHSPRAISPGRRLVSTLNRTGGISVSDSFNIINSLTNL